MEKRKKELLAGSVLILIGILIFILSSVSGISSFHLFLGGAFLAGYFYSGAYGLLIPGCLLTGLALGSTKSSFFGFSDFNELAFGLGFIAIYVIDRLYQGKSHWWPLIPGSVFVLIGLESIDTIRSYGWPLLLIVLGIVILIRSFAKNRSEQ